MPAMAIIELPREVVDKIAAGEVVERPASVVKELVENSLDAGARFIEVEIRGGGLDLIRVSDDGRGMDPVDLRLSVRPHATSKIASYEDILEASSYGFRGEALPSIASVSRLSVTSRTEGSAAGWRLECGAGLEVREAEAAAATGTSVEVGALFANVPARRKFLRSPMTESRRCQEEVYHQALANPAVGFRFLSEGRTTLELLPAESSERWRQALGDELFGSMAPVDRRSGDLSLAGLVSRAGRLWPRRREQHVYINGRRVQSRTASSAAYQAYGPSLEGRHPCFILMISMPARSVDVNVHPAKLQVRFRDDDLVFRFVRNSLERALFGRDEAPLGGDASLPPEGPETGPRTDGWQRLTAAEQRSIFDLAALPEGPPAPVPGETRRAVVQFWQVHNRYIMASIKNGVIMVDQHAAHERVLYEELLGRSGGPRSQQLLFPATLELTPPESLVMAEYRDAFSSLGFDLKEFGGRTVVIEGLPSSTAEADAGAVIRGMLADLGGTQQSGFNPMERVARSFACHAAVKAGQPLSQEEMNRLIDRLFATSSPYLDPHGRPAVIKFTLDDLERRFGRV